MLMDINDKFENTWRNPGGNILSLSYFSCNSICEIFVKNDLPTPRLPNKFENTWRNPGEMVEVNKLPTIDEFMDVVEDMCLELGIKFSYNSCTNSIQHP